MKIIKFPGKYIQGPDMLAALSCHIKPLGLRWLVLFDIALEDQLPCISNQTTDELHFHFERFNGQCSRQEIQRVAALAGGNKFNGIIGFGGGKVLDTAKAVAFYQDLRSIMLPTVASTDAPTSALSALYSEEGEFEEYMYYPTNPDMVIVDSNIIANAPVRLLVSGMGNALSTWFEAQACYSAHATNMAGGQTTRAAIIIARLCYDTLLQEGGKAKVAVAEKVTCPALERVIEANIYLSGIGFESSGLAAAHAIHNGLTRLEECHHYYHGEKVAFGTLAQLVLQNSSNELINEVLDFCISIGLPVCLEELGVTDDVMKKMKIVAEKSCSVGETIFNMSSSITVKEVYSALIIANQLGRQKLSLANHH